MTNERILESLFRAIDEVNQHLPQEQQVEKFADTVLVGESGNLDSLGLISLLVAVEQAIEKEFRLMIDMTGVILNLTGNGSAQPKENMPLHTVATLVSHISELLEVKKDG